MRSREGDSIPTAYLPAPAPVPGAALLAPLADAPLELPACAPAAGTVPDAALEPAVPFTAVPAAGATAAVPAAPEG
jgi:hypothetical protein